MASIKTDRITQKKKNILKNNKGQSLVEFILLITAIMLISSLFLRITGSGIAKYWLYMGKLLTEDSEQRIELR